MDEAPVAPVELEGLRVTIDRLVYQRLSDMDSPDRPHSFVYFISIRNDSPLAVTIKGRKWVVRHDDGTSLVVEGDGVVGEFPTVGSGESYSYNSRHIIVTRTALAEGAYLGLDETGRRVVVRIPRFGMVVPDDEFDAE